LSFTSGKSLGKALDLPSGEFYNRKRKIKLWSQNRHLTHGKKATKMTLSMFSS